MIGWANCPIYLSFSSKEEIFRERLFLAKTTHALVCLLRRRPSGPLPAIGLALTLWVPRDQAMRGKVFEDGARGGGRQAEIGRHIGGLGIVIRLDEVIGASAQRRHRIERDVPDQPVRIAPIRDTTAELA